MTREELLSDLTPETFIAWVESIPEDQWCNNNQTDPYGRHCFHGFLSIIDYGEAYLAFPGTGKISNFFADTFTTRHNRSPIACINNGNEWDCKHWGLPYYNNPTPKQRVLAFLRDEYAHIKKLELNLEKEEIKEEI